MKMLLGAALGALAILVLIWAQSGFAQLGAGYSYFAFTKN